MAYATDLMHELVGIFTNSIGNMSSSMIVVLLVFANEQLLSKANAKLFFVLGYFIFMVIFYTFGVLCFPKGGGSEEEEGEDEGGVDGDDDDGEEAGRSQTLVSASFRKRMMALIPLHNATTASFYSFSLGYLLGYWANLNVAKKTPNAMQNVCIYIAIAFVFFLFTVYIVRSCSWSSALLSICVGTIFGMIWSSMVADKIEGVVEEVGGGSSVAKESEIAGASMCDGSSRDGAVCQAFRL